MPTKQLIRQELLKSTLEKFSQHHSERYSPGIFFSWLQNNQLGLNALEVCESMSTLETFDDCLPSTELIWLVSQLLASRESQNILADSAYRLLPSAISLGSPAAKVFSPQDRLGIPGRTHWTDGAFEGTYQLYSGTPDQRFDAIAIIPYRDNRDWDTEYGEYDIQCDDSFYLEADRLSHFYDKLTEDAVFLWFENAKLGARCDAEPFKNESTLASLGFHVQAAFECPVSSFKPAHSVGWLYLIEKKQRPPRIPLYKIESSHSFEDKVGQVEDSLNLYRSGKIQRTFPDQISPSAQFIDLRQQFRKLACDMNVPAVACREFLLNKETRFGVYDSSRWAGWKLDAEKLNNRYLDMIFETPVGLAMTEALDALCYYHWDDFILETQIPLPSLQHQASSFLDMSDITSTNRHCLID